MKLKKITSNLMVSDVGRSVVFYRDTLGFSLVMAVDAARATDSALREHAQYLFAIVSRDGVDLMLQRAESLREDLPFLGKRPAGFSGNLYFEVEGLAAFYEQVKTRAATALRTEPETSWYGMREFCAEDPDGHVIAFGERQG
ncbi:glyoxalase [Opitutaceae bacterium TAV5]|nr:glyoxalase [Opitutaceae bacterium TAV5]